MVPPCRKTIEISQLQYTVIDVPVVQVEQVISPSWRSGRSMGQTVRRTFFFHNCSTRWPMSLLCRSSCFPGAVVKETVEISQLPPWWSWVDGWIFRTLYTGTGPGVVFTGTRPHD